MEVPDEEDPEFGVAKLHGRNLVRSSATGKDVEMEDVENDADEAPALVNRDLGHLQAVLDIADVVIELLDARDPLSFRSKHLETIVTSKTGCRILLVLNKVGM